jgi:ribosome maturation factor RimP
VAHFFVGATDLSERDEPFGMIADSQLAPVAALVRPAVEALGFDLVRLSFGAGGKATLQIMAERPDGSQGTIDDYAAISRAVSAVLDEKDPIAGAYMLEVSSPGIDRPLTRARDFARWAGFEARLETKGELAGRTRFHGQILKLDGDAVLLREEAGEVSLPLAALKRARLVLNDHLLAATKRAA